MSSKSAHTSRRRMSIRLGNAIEITGLSYAILSLFLVNPVPHPLQKLMLLLTSWFCFWFFSHCLAHFVVGRIFGVNFLYYFVGKSSLIKLNLPFISFFAKIFPVLGIKMDKASFKNLSPKKQAVVFASGALASMISPLICLIYAIIYLEAWIGGFLSVMTTGNIVFTLIFSAKVGDLSKARKSLRVSHKSNV